MPPEPALFTPEEIVLILTPKLVIDGFWKREFGQEIEHHIRDVADALFLLVHKYPFVTHRLFVETVQEVCGINNDRLTSFKADQIITEAVSLNIISCVRPTSDQRHVLYYFTEDQRNILVKIARGSLDAYKLATEQAKDPLNPYAALTKDDAVLTEDNRLWYRNAWHLIARLDEEWQKVTDGLKGKLHLSMHAPGKWEKHMTMLKKIWELIQKGGKLLLILVALGGAIEAASIIFSVPGNATLSGTTK